MATLHYFNGRGRSAQPRWALAAAEVPYNVNALMSPEDFDKLSDRLSFRQVPMLETADGRCLSQSMAIVRHAARLGRLYGANDDEASRIDELMDGVTDARLPILRFPFIGASEACEMLVPLLQKYLAFFERAAAHAGVAPEKPYLVGSRLSMADVLLAELVHSATEALEYAPSDGSPEQSGAGVLAAFPLVQLVHRHVVALPQMQRFLLSENCAPFPSPGAVGDAYVANVRTVLRRG